jgi:hypothetical protein
MKEIRVKMIQVLEKENKMEMDRVKKCQTIERIDNLILEELMGENQEMTSTEIVGMRWAKLEMMILMKMKKRN